MDKFPASRLLEFEPDEMPRRTVCLNTVWLSFLVGLMEKYTFSRAWSGDEQDIMDGVNYSNLVVKKLMENCMIGQVVMFGVETLPDNVLICDGRTFSRLDYPRLYEITPGARIIDADNASTPDLRSRFIISEGDGGNSLTTRPLFSEGGSETHTLTVNEIPSHKHETQPHAHSYNYPSVNVDLEAPGAPDIAAVGNPPTPVQTGFETVEVDNTGGGEAHDNMPPYYALIFAIVAQ